MKRSRNADEFLNCLRGMTIDYNERFRRRIDEAVQRYKERPERMSDDAVDGCLEAHLRVFFVNTFLAALNWRMDAKLEDGLPNLLPEVPIESATTGTTRFLDYLGLEAESGDPLLIVETKRPSSGLPRLRSDRRRPEDDRDQTRRARAREYADVISRGLAGEVLREDWSEWLATLRDYVRSVHARGAKPPLRAVVTSGQWMVIFCDPSDAFLSGGSADPARIVVLLDSADLESCYDDVFGLLEHGSVVGSAAGIAPGELGFHLRGQEIVRVMHGLIVRYIEIDGIYGQSPVVRVAPILFVRSRFGAWLRVEAAPSEFGIPSERELLPGHLGEVQAAAHRLLEEVAIQIGKSIAPCTLTDHYGEEGWFEELTGVSARAGDGNVYVVVTGDKTHYLIAEATVEACPYHDWRMSKREDRAATESPIESRSVNPRSFFKNQEEHHCTHRNVQAAKASRITQENRSRCGMRSGKDGQAFCEIWRFEEYLCCRTCAFEEVCTKAEVFNLPCSR